MKTTPTKAMTFNVSEDRLQTKKGVDGLKGQIFFFNGKFVIFIPEI